MTTLYLAFFIGLIPGIGAFVAMLYWIGVASRFREQLEMSRKEAAAWKMSADYFRAAAEWECCEERAAGIHHFLREKEAGRIVEPNEPREEPSAKASMFNPEDVKFLRRMRIKE